MVIIKDLFADELINRYEEKLTEYFSKKKGVNNIKLNMDKIRNDVYKVIEHHEFIQEIIDDIDSYKDDLINRLKNKRYDNISMEMCKDNKDTRKNINKIIDRLKLKDYNLIDLDQYIVAMNIYIIIVHETTELMEKIKLDEQYKTNNIIQLRKKDTNNN